MMLRSPLLLASAWAVLASIAMPTSGQDSADDVLERAHQARASWGPAFPGFTADVAVQGEGPEARGTLRVSPQGEVTLDMPEGPARTWARSQLRSIVMHRGLDGPPHQEPGSTFAEPESEGDSNPLGRLIRLSGGDSQSAYRIKGDEIREVNRTMGKTRFTNVVLESMRNAEGKTLPLAYSTSYFDAATGKLQRVETIHDSWARVGKLDLPRSRTQVTATDGKSQARRLELSGHKIIGAAEAPAR